MLRQIVVFGLLFLGCSTSREGLEKKQVETASELPQPHLNVHSVAMAKVPPKNFLTSTLAWDGPCMKPVKAKGKRGKKALAKAGVPIAGFNLSLVDGNDRVLKRTFIQAKKKDPWGCGVYKTKIGKVISEEVAQALRNNEEFRGYIAVSTVSQDQSESPVALMRFPSAPDSLETIRR